MASLLMQTLIQELTRRCRHFRIPARVPPLRRRDECRRNSACVQAQVCTNRKRALKQICRRIDLWAISVNSAFRTLSSSLFANKVLSPF